MIRRWGIPGSLVLAVAMVLAFWQFALGGVPWVDLPGAAALLPGEPVALATYDGDGTSCYTNAEPYLLVPDAPTGVAMVGLQGVATASGGRLPVAWPSGYVGRRVGSEVAVYGPSGVLVATTGRWWYMAATPNDMSDPYTNPFRVGCTAHGLTEWDPNSTPPPG